MIGGFIAFHHRVMHDSLCMPVRIPWLQHICEPQRDGMLGILWHKVRNPCQLRALLFVRLFVTRYQFAWHPGPQRKQSRDIFSCVATRPWRRLE